MLDQLEPLDEGDAIEVRDLVAEHVRRTGSTVGQRVLDEFDALLPRFVKVFPTDYKRVLARARGAEEDAPGRAAARPTSSPARPSTSSARRPSGWGRARVGELGAFLKITRHGVPYADPVERVRDRPFEEFLVRRTRRRARRAGRALHGVRRARSATTAARWGT